MKKLLMIFLLMFNSSCSDEQVALTGEILGASLALALIANYSHAEDGQYYYRVNSRECYSYYEFYNNNLQRISLISCRYFDRWSGIYAVTNTRYNSIRVYQPRF